MRDRDFIFALAAYAWLCFAAVALSVSTPEPGRHARAKGTWKADVHALAQRVYARDTTNGADIVIGEPQTIAEALGLCALRYADAPASTECPS